jgi:hypothetical protein
MSLYPTILASSVFSAGWSIRFAVWSSPNQTGIPVQYRVLPEIIKHDNIVISSDTPGVYARVLVEYDLIDPSPSTGMCTFLRFQGHNITIKDLFITIPPQCILFQSTLYDVIYNGVAFLFDGYDTAIHNVHVTGATLAFVFRNSRNVGSVVIQNTSTVDMFVVPLHPFRCWLAHINAAAGRITVNSTCSITTRDISLGLTYLQEVNVTDLDGIFIGNNYVVQEQAYKDEISYPGLTEIIFVSVLLSVMLVFFIYYLCTNKVTQSKVFCHILNCFRPPKQD